MEEVKWTTWRPEPVTITRHPLQDESGRFTEPPAVKWPLTVYSMEELEFGATQGLYNAFFYNGPDDDTCRILGAFWQHLPESGQLLIMAEIVYLSCHKDPLGSLRQLADFLIEAIIKPLTAANVQNGPLFIETGHEVWDKTVPLEPRYDWTNGAVALRERVLKRDGHRCVLTGLVDVRRFLETDRGDRLGVSSGETRCAYILPFALSHAPTPSRTEDLNITWRALYRYFPYLQGRIGWHTICSPANTITLSAFEYREFVSFKSEVVPDNSERRTYHCHSFKPRPAATLGMKIRGDTYLPLPPTVVMENHSSDETQMPNPLFLFTHSRLARIVRATRVGYKPEYYT